MGQKYEGTLIIQTNDNYSPIGTKILTPVENPASSDDVISGKGLYDSNGNYISGSLVDGWPVEIDTEEGMDAFANLENAGRYVKYTGTSGGEGAFSVPVNPVIVGEKITEFHFNTEITPDFTKFDWSQASEIEGPTATGKYINLVEGTTSNETAEYRLQVAWVPAGSVIDGYTYIKDNYMIVAGTEDDGLVYWTEEYAQSLGSKGGWLTSVISVGDTLVTSVVQQDVWGGYISKDGKWTTAISSKYTSGQIYQVVQQGGSAELKPIQY